MRRLGALLIALLALPAVSGQTGDELNFVAPLPDGREYRTMLPALLERKADEALAQRARRIAELSRPEQVEAHKRRTRERLVEALGGLPVRTPLHARTAGVLERPDHTIEKIVFESQPGFHVTANLYLPRGGRPPYPAILFPLGHEAGAKANADWQHVLVSLARRGFAALAWDTIGQGERVQLYDEDFQASKVVRSTTEHTLVGIQCLLVGDNLARYTIWDGIRALDYLLSRREVDPTRIGCTGNSGGGTHTAYLAALDDRIHAAAPSCYITSWRRLLETIGPQDAEQCLPPSLADGLDHADFVLAFAPKPYLVLSAIRDFFSIRGARESFAEARRVYDVLGAAGRIEMFEADDGHGYTRPRRSAAYRFFARALQKTDDAGDEPEVPIAGEEELRCTPSGQVSVSLGGETVFTLNQKRLDALRPRAGRVSIEEVRRAVCFDPTRAPLTVREFGRLDRTGYRIEKLVYESEPGIAIPSLLYVPTGNAGRRPAVIVVDGNGKASARSENEELAREGLVVLAIDARGLGETRTASDNNGSDWPRYFGDFDSAMTALLVGEPLVGMRAEDVARGIDLLAARAEVDPQEIYGLGRNAGALPLLYAASFDARLRKVAFDRMLASYESVVRRRIHRQVFEGIVRGALRHYDIADLVASLAPRPVWLVDPADPLGQPLPLPEAERSYARAADAYRAGGKHGELRLVRRKPGAGLRALLPEMLPVAGPR